MESNLQAFEIEPAVDAPREGRNQLAFPWRRKGIVLSMLLIGLGLGYTYFVRTPPVYQSRAQVLIIEESAKLPVEGVEFSMSSDEIHQLLIQSQTVLEDAVVRGELSQLPSLRDEPSPERVIMGGLTVETAATNWGTGNVLDVAYQGSHREDCPKILRAVIDAYKEFLAEFNQDMSKQAILLIRQARNELGGQLEQVQGEYKAWRDNRSPIVVDENGLNLHEAQALRMRERLMELNLENTKLAAQIESLESDPEAGRRDVLNLIIETIGSAAGNLGEELVEDDGVAPKELIPLKLQEFELVDRFGSEHPKVLAIRKKIRLVERLLTPNEKEEVDYFKLYLDSLRKTVDINEQEIASIKMLYDEELLEAKSLGNDEITALEYQDQIERISRFHDAVVGRLEEIDLFKNRKSSDVQAVNRPSAGIQVAPELARVMLVSGVLGLFAGLGLAFLVDEVDRRFHSPEEIREDFGVPVVGHIPVIAAGKSARQLPSLEDPSGAIAEAYRAVRTAIYFNARGGGQRVIQVTSPSPGDGKTTLVANLAVSIANSGKSVLLIDADFRRPRCHRVFGVGNEVGMSCVLDGKVEWTEAVQSTAAPNLSLLTCGERPQNPSELLASQRFGEFVEFIQQKYDLVIIDTPPVLVVTDALNVAARADAVLMVLRLTKTARHAGRQALDALEEVGTKILGIVVNQVGGNHSYGSNNYSAYKYRYGNAYGYANGYRYKDKDGYGYGDTDEEVQADRLAADHKNNGSGGR